MSVQLFEHNQRAYAKVEAMLETAGKAAVIHPTGTGKSYIAFKLIEMHPEAKFLWLSPSDYIFRTQTEALRESDPDMELDRVRFFTYAKLMLLAREDLRTLAADYIIFDEFHRCGAERWGEGVGSLIDTHPDAKMLGLSATNIRYLDNQRDIAQELFDGNIASQMTLGECIVRGILPKPRYVTTVFRYRKELEKYQARIDAIKDPGLRRKNQTYYDALRRALEQADGLDVILKKYITKTDGKYLIFCSDYDHLTEMKEMTAEWFRAINPEVHAYVAYSNDPETSTAFRSFKADRSKALKLLFCIDMLNEGVHVKGISGVILLRPTLSPIVYKQQIGRALTSGDNTTPLILDVVNNFEGLSSISAIQQEMEEAALFLSQIGESHRIVAERFEVEEQVRDCVKLFEALEDSLSAPWDHYFEQARDYYRDHQNLNVPKNFDTPDGLHLGQWLCTQRALYRNCRQRLSAEQIDRLESIGMEWDRFDDKRWDVNYEAALRYYETHGNLRVSARYVTPEGIRLGRWIVNLRRRYQAAQSGQTAGVSVAAPAPKDGSANDISVAPKDGLSDERIRQMEAIGMIWDEGQAQWQHHFGCAARYYDENGHLQVPVDYMTEDGFALGKWLAQMRAARRGKTKQRLSDSRIAQLSSIGMVWEKRGDLTWFDNYEKARAYYEAHGNLDVASSYRTPEGFALGKWLRRQQYAFENPDKSNSVLTDERIRLLGEIGLRLERQELGIA